MVSRPAAIRIEKSEKSDTIIIFCRRVVLSPAALLIQFPLIIKKIIT